MEEKFYYTRKLIKREIIAVILGGILSPAMALSIFVKYGLGWLTVIVFLLIVFSLFYIKSLLDAIDNPAVVITDDKIITRSLSFGRGGVGLGQIISGAYSEIDERVDIKHRKANGDEATFSIKHLSRVDNYQKLIELLKQRIKFV